MSNFISRLYRIVACFSLLLLLNACGGGLGGSGDGGNDSNSLILLPDTFVAPYQFRHVPQRLIARFPPSLAADSAVEKPSGPSPYGKLTSTIGHLIDTKLEIGLIQLHIEANWEQIMEHCTTTAEDAPCDLLDAGISAPYTEAMASWEFILRAEIALEQSGDINTLTDDTRASIEQQVTARIGTPVSIDNGIFTRNSSGSHRYDIVITTDIGFDETIYTLRWSEDKELTFISLTEIEQNIVDSFQSSTNNQQSSSGFTNAILMTTYDNGARQERQLNINQPVNSHDLRVESQLTEIIGPTKTDYYSIGNAGTLGGYISSEQSSEDASDIKVSDFLRESFTEDAQLGAQSICRDSQSVQQCDDENRWEVVTNLDPVTTQFFRTPLQLNDVENRVRLFDLNIEGISSIPDTILLIRRENLTISLSEEGIVITLPGLGTFDFTDNMLSPEPDFDADNPQQLGEYADSVLCRINTALVNNQTEYRPFCAGPIEDIEKALVIGESFREGKLVIEWQANAIVEAMEN
ncbi:MAG: hypothetical protein AB8B87_07565 [Granulosicoccus sp.]